MTNIKIKGTINLTTKDKDAFITDFSKFLKSHKAVLIGSVEFTEFINAESVND